MLPFRVELQPGRSVYEQVVYAVKKAMVLGRVRPGDRFPSVRKLSQELKINPNTAHRVVAALTREGLLEVRPGIGTMVARAPAATPRDRRALLQEPLERVVVEAKKLHLELDDVADALAEHWHRLSGEPGSASAAAHSRDKETS